MKISRWTICHEFQSNQGDEIDVLNDSWLFILWSSDHSPFLSNSVCSRWPVAVIPKAYYLMDDATGVNLTVQAIPREIVESFNKLSTDGIKLRDVPSMGGGIVTWFCLRYEYFLGPCNILHPSNSSSDSCRFWKRTLCFSIFQKKKHSGRSIAQVARLNFYCMGRRGDWKALRQVFNLDRFYNTDKVVVGKHSTRTVFTTPAVMDFT